MTSGKFKSFPLSGITIDRATRQRRELTGIDDLAASIEKIGLINPPVIRKDGTLVAGERRVTACQQLGWSHIPVQFIEDLPELEAKLIELEENLRRVDLSWQDQAAAIAQYHDLSAQSNEEWSGMDTCRVLNLSPPVLSRNLLVAKALDEGNPRVVEAPKFSVAYGIVQRDQSRRKASTIAEVGAIPLTKKDAEAPAPAPAADTAPLLLENFHDWIATYDGPKFNFIHCDFPYGIGADKHNQGNAAARGGYADSKDVYFTLLSTLCNNLDTFCAPSAHLMFWFSMDYYRETVDALRDSGFTVNARPLIWFRSDNSGILPDPKRGPRRVYETALLGSRGDRLVAQAVADVVASPNVKSVHMSEKPRPVLRHFFRMFVDEHSYVLDPTCGSGNALRVARDMGAKYCLGLERDEEFYERALERWNEDD